MIIALGGKPGSGKSTVAKLLAKKLSYKQYSMGDFQRTIAQQRGISIVELGKLEEKDPTLDKEVDNLQTNLGNNEDNFVIDSRLGFHFIPRAKKVFLDCDFELRAKRILNDQTRKEHNPNIKKAKENIKQREKSETLRYKKYYDLNPYDEKNFDSTIDTTNLTVEQTTDKILDFLNQKA